MDVLSIIVSIMFPLSIALCRDANPRTVSQLAIKIMEKPKMETNRKLRYMALGISDRGSCRRRVGD